jgi:hypothetical protein
MAGYPCCCQVYPCAEDCSAGVPDEISVDISGAANDGCIWTGLDGTYLLTYQTCTRWQASFTSPIVQQTYSGVCYGSSPEFELRINVYFQGGYIKGVVTANWFSSGTGFLIEQHHFRLAVTTPVDCCSWAALDLPYQTKTVFPSFSGYGGDLSSATFEITSGACV